MRTTYFVVALLLSCISVNAQDDKPEKKTKSISITSDGIKFNDNKEEKAEKAFKIEVGGVDIGVNTLIDNSNYGSAAAQGFLNVPQNMQNENLFSLRNGKSINVNVWPVIGSWQAVKGDKQKIYLSTGVGLQMYNFRFSKNITYLNVTNPMVIADSNAFTKNKLGFTYLSVPLMVTFKTKMAEKAWLVYGVGVTGGYRLDSWTKQISGTAGKVKNHDRFNFSDFNSCLTGEVGLDDYFRLYVTYQITPMHETALDQRPLCIGLRIGGV